MLYVCIPCSLSKEAYRFTMFTFSSLVNAWSIQSFCKRLQLSYTLFCSQNIDEKVKLAYTSLEKVFTTLGDAGPKENEQLEPEEEGQNSIEDDVVRDNKEEERLNKLAKKPFYPFIIGKLKDVYTITDPKKPKNPLYNSSWQDIMETKWISLIPLWTSVLRG